MNIDDIRSRVGAILAAEERQPPDWAEVGRLTDELQRQLIAESNIECPEIVDRYLDDAGIRSSDAAYGKHQRHQVGRFVATGEYQDSTPVPFWTCAVALGAFAGVIGWLVWRR